MSSFFHYAQSRGAAIAEMFLHRRQGLSALPPPPPPPLPPAVLPPPPPPTVLDPSTTLLAPISSFLTPTSTLLASSTTLLSTTSTLIAPSPFETTALIPQNGTNFLSNITSITNMTNITIGDATGGGFNGTTNSNFTSNPGPAFQGRVNHENYGPQVNFTIWLLTALSAMFLALRVYCKFLRHRGLWWDDYVLIASWISIATSCGFVSYTIVLGFGRPLHDFDFKLLVPFLLNTNFAGSFSILAALWSKTSFAITVLRISDGWTKKFVWFIIISINIALGLSVAFTWGQCWPLEKIYRPSVPGKCWPKFYQIRYNIFCAAYAGAMDIILAILPWRIIWSLTMNKKEKIGVLIAMSMGIFAGITSIVKITTLPGIGNSDFTEATTQLLILGTAESTITIMAASIPILRALIRDSGPPTVPAEFYHDFNLYTGTNGSRGTGRTSTVITSGGRSRSASRGSSRWSKDFFEGDGGGPGGGGTGIGLGSLRRWSQRSQVHQRGGSAVSTLEVQLGPGMQALPPPGKILTTEEVVVEYEKNRVSGIGNAW